MDPRRIANAENDLLKPVFKSESGTQFYALHDPLTISPERGVSAEENRRFAEMCISKSELKGLIKEYKKGVNNQDIVYSHSIIQEMEYRLDFIVEKNSLFDLASLYFYIEGEDVRIPMEKYTKMKKKMFDEETDVKGFFLPIALNLLKECSPKQESDLLIYLEQIEHLRKRINRFLPNDHWKNSGDT